MSSPKFDQKRYPRAARHVPVLVLPIHMPSAPDENQPNDRLFTLVDWLSKMARQNRLKNLSLPSGRVG